MQPVQDAGPERPVMLNEAALTALLVRAFLRLGVSAENAPVVAAVVAAAERDGAGGHGLLRMPGYASSLRSGWVDGRAVPRVEAVAPSVLAVDGRNGFAQVALAAARDQAVRMAAETGLCAVLMRDTHHFAALWPDVEAFAEAGLIAISMVTSVPHMVAWGSRTKLLGTNPLAFACPRPHGPPLVWDQASSLRAQGEVLLARRDGHRVPPGTGVDAAGDGTTDPAAILDGGALLPAGGAKGANIALMAEILVAALGGGRFGFAVDKTGHPDAQTSNTGQFVLLIDPGRSGGDGVLDRVGLLLDHAQSAGVSRLPGDRRHACRAQARLSGIPIPAAAYRDLAGLAGEAGQAL